MNTRPLRIAIASAGRFHVLDLARELDALGHEVRFYSYVPRRRASAFGLPRACHVDLFAALAPLALLQTHAPAFAPKLIEPLTWKALNQAVIATLRPCEVFIFMSGIYLEAAVYARKRFGAKLVLVRGSKHILAQDEILANVPGAQRPSLLAVERERRGYAIADCIDIPSSHVQSSFERDPRAHSVSVLNPYGVDLKSFPLLQRPPLTKRPVFIFAGTWSLQKGCDLLVEAMRSLPSARLIHVGALGDARFPHNDPQFEHIPKVDQTELSHQYAKAHALVLPSRQDGFGLVLAQALASGLPVVCTDATGGGDVTHTPALADRIKVVAAGDLRALATELAAMCARLAHGPEFAPMTEADRATLSWQAYAQRYVGTLSRLAA